MSIHKNIKKDRGTKNEFHKRIFCKTLIRQHSCTTHYVQTVPVLAAILQKILWNSIISYLYLSLYFYEYLKTFSYKIKNFQVKRLYVKRHRFSIFVVADRYYYCQYSKTYTLCSGLNNVNYLNIIKRDHVSATVRTRLHLASGWSLDHSGA